MLKAARNFFLLIVLLLPTTAFASSYYRLDTTPLFVSSKDLYRISPYTGNWQKAVLPTGATIEQTAQYGSALWLLIKTAAGEQLLVTQDGLRLASYASLPNSSGSQLWPTAHHLYLTTEKESHLAVYELTAGLTKRDIPTSIDGNTILAFGDSYLLTSDGNFVTLLSLKNSQYQQVGNVTCQQPLVSDSELICTNQIYLVSETVFQPIFGSPADLVATSDGMAVGLSLSTSMLTIFDLATASYTVKPIDINNEIVQALLTSKHRLFLQTNQGYYELSLADSSVVKIGSAASRLVSEQNGQRLYLSDGPASWASDQSMLWQAIQTVGSFNHAVELDGQMHSLYQTLDNGGGLLQVESTPNAFSKVNPWSSTGSPIYALVAGEPSYALVITSNGQGNANLYQSADNLHWSRLSLPSQPTFVGDIASLRQLPAGSLVEAIGTATSNFDEIASNVFYFQDASAGMQAYLSKSDNYLDVVKNHQVTVTGQISSSETKRIVLGSQEDLAVGSYQPVSPADATSQVGLVSLLGKLVRVSGQISSQTSSSAYLKEFGSTLRLAIAQLTSHPHVGDEVSFQGVIDQDGEGFQALPFVSSWQLLSAANDLTATTATATHSAPKSTQSKKAPSSTTKAKTSLAKAARPGTATLPTVVSESTSVPAPNSVSELVICGFLAGILVVQGRRFPIQSISN